MYVCIVKVHKIIASFVANFDFRYVLIVVVTLVVYCTVCLTAVAVFLGYPSKPQVVKSTSLIELVQTNFNFSMQCESNVRDARIHWEKRNETLSPYAHGVNSWNLTIFNMIPDDSGEYRCVVTNSTGTIESEYSKLTVRGT